VPSTLPSTLPSVGQPSAKSSRSVLLWVGIVVALVFLIALAAAVYLLVLPRLGLRT
jgi:hypothetical protein